MFYIRQLLIIGMLTAAITGSQLSPASASAAPRPGSITPVNATAPHQPDELMGTPGGAGSPAGLSAAGLSATAALGKPKNFKVKFRPTSAHFSWSKVKGATSYYVYTIGHDFIGPPAPKVITSKSSADIAYSKFGSDKSTVYTFYVAAVRGPKQAWSNKVMSHLTVSQVILKNLAVREGAIDYKRKASSLMATCAAQGGKMALAGAGLVGAPLVYLAIINPTTALGSIAIIAGAAATAAGTQFLYCLGNRG